jgi:hypothetical protein
MSENAVAVAPAPAAVAARRWIVSPGFDLGWFFGGVVASLALLALFFAAKVPILALWWIWLLAFDGPHIGAAFTRTYVDREEWRARRGVLLGSLLSFAVGPVFLVAGLVAGSPEPFRLFLGLAALYGIYHVVRQHYGFLALYKAVNRDFDRVDFHIDKWALYAGAWAPYVWFQLVHPEMRRLLRLEAHVISPVEGAVAWGMVGLWALAIVVFAARAVARGKAGAPKFAYVLLTLGLYGAVYFVAGRYEPAYPAARTPDQMFMLVMSVLTIFHNVQYLGLLWLHNRNRYAGRGDWGAARAVNRNVGAFLAFCLAFSGLVYFTFAASTGVFAGVGWFLDAKIGPVRVNDVGLCLWWGLAIHHYYLDQKIWRIRGDAQLKKNLGLT